MCGIVGVIQYESPIDREIRTRALRILFSDMMLKTETRGEDATGLYQLHRDGVWMMLKKGQKVSDWLLAETEGDEVYYRDFMETWTEYPHELTALVGHCRKATTGSRGHDNNDNHPFAVQLDEEHAILGVHNGTLYNHETIFRKLGGHLTRQGTVDSESIFHFLYYLTEQGTLPVTKEMLEYMGERIDGGYAVIAANSRFPHQIITFRHERPLEFMMIRPLNIVAVASEKRFIESALEKYEFMRQLLDRELPKLEYADRTLAAGDFRIFDTSKRFPELKPIWNDFEKISQYGQMRRAGSYAVKDDWKSSTSTQSYSGTGAYHYPHGSAGKSTSKTSQQAGGVKTSKSTGSTAQQSTSSTRALPSNAGKKEKTIVVDAEILEASGDGDVNKGYEKARSLGLCPDYSMVREVAHAIGKTENDVNLMSVAEIATAVGEVHFHYGYALARLDSKTEVEKVRAKAREQLSRIEKDAEKKARAQSRIWEHKQLFTILLSLSRAGYPLTERNVGVVLSQIPQLSKQRRDDILSTATAAFRDQGTMRMVRELIQKFQTAEKRKRRQAREQEAEAEEQ